MGDGLELGSSVIQGFVQTRVFIGLRLQPAVRRLQLIPRIMSRLVSQPLILGLQDQPLVDVLQLNQGQQALIG